MGVQSAKDDLDVNTTVIDRSAATRRLHLTQNRNARRVRRDLPPLRAQEVEGPSAVRHQARRRQQGLWRDFSHAAPRQYGFTSHPRAFGPVWLEAVPDQRALRRTPER